MSNYGQKLEFFKVDKQYIDYLRKEDIKKNGFSCVPKLDYIPPAKEKFMCGIVLMVGGLEYLAPISSYTKQQSDNILLYDSDGKVTSSIRFNFMFPVAPDVYHYFDISKETDPKYRDVVRQELASVNAQRKNIYKQAAITYQKVNRIRKSGNNITWACNFIDLEKFSVDWRLNDKNIETLLS